MKAAVLIPTFRRPENLRAALHSVAAQNDLSQIERVIVIDNDPEASAAPVLEAFAEIAPFPVQWVHAADPGVSNARNAGVAMARDANFIAFLDDDETAHPEWLSALLSTQAQTAADVVFGPISGRAPDAKLRQRAFIEEFFSRTSQEPSGVIDRTYGCGNSLMRVATALSEPAPFAIEANETGGEDDMLFTRLVAKGAVFAWAADAWVDEHAPAERATLGYVMTRAFAYGQGPSQTAAEQKRWLSAARWMVIGAGQFIVHGAVGTALTLIRQPSAYPHLRKAVEGLGKLFWFNGFEPKLYGAHQLKMRA